MDKIKNFFITYKIHAILFIAGGALGFGLTLLFPAKTQVKLIKESRTVSEKKQIIDKNDTKKLYDCYNSDIKINGLMRDNELIISAEDQCKKSMKKFSFSCVSAKKNAIQLNYAAIYYQKNLVHQASIMYYRDLFLNFSIGFGFLGQKGLNDFGIGGIVGIQYKF